MVSIGAAYCGHMSQNGEKIHSETEMNINFIFSLPFPPHHPPPIPTSGWSCFSFFFVRFLCVFVPSKSFRSTTVNVVGCYCNIKWKIPQQLFPAARSLLRHFPFSIWFEWSVCVSVCARSAFVCISAYLQRQMGIPKSGSLYTMYARAKVIVCEVTYSDAEVQRHRHHHSVVELLVASCRIDYCELIDWRLFSVWMENGI